MIGNGFVFEDKYEGLKFELLVIGAINNPEIMKIPKIDNKINVRIINVLIASILDLKTTILIKIIIKIAIIIANGFKTGKNTSITKVKAWAEKENATIFAIQRKNPIIKQSNY